MEERKRGGKGDFKKRTEGEMMKTLCWNKNSIGKTLIFLAKKDALCCKCYNIQPFRGRF